MINSGINNTEKKFFGIRTNLVGYICMVNILYFGKEDGFSEDFIPLNPSSWPVEFLNIANFYLQSVFPFEKYTCSELRKMLVLYVCNYETVKP